MQISLELITLAMMDGAIGFCLACGDAACPVEPDDKRCYCTSCDADEVYGAEEILMMGETKDEEWE